MNKKTKIFLCSLLLLAIGVLVYSLQTSMLIFAAYHLVANSIIPIKQLLLPLLLFVLFVGAIFFVLFKKNPKSANIYLLILFIIFSFLSLQYRLSQTQLSLNDAKLSHSANKILQNNGVDVFPTELKFIKQNNLKWHPRPNPFISKSDISSDIANATFLQADYAPKYILYNNLNSQELISLINKEPQFFYQLLNQYSLIYNSDNIAIFEKSTKPNYPITRNIPSKNIIMSEWVDVPQKDNSLIQIKILPQKTVWGNILCFLGSTIYIEYQFKDGSIKKHELPTLNTSNTIWINPYFENINSAQNTLTVKRIKFTTKNNFFYEKTIPCAWVVIPIQ